MSGPGGGRRRQLPRLSLVFELYGYDLCLGKTVIKRRLKDVWAPALESTGKTLS